MLGITGPFEHKLEGLYWTTSLIALWSIVYKIANLAQVAFKHIRIITTFKAIMMCDMMFFIVVCSYYVDINIFLYGSASLGVFYSILSSLSTNQFNDLVNKHFSDKFNDLQYLNDTLFVIGGISGSLMLIGVEKINSVYTVPVLLIMIGILVLWQVYLLGTTWKEIERIDDEKSLL